MATITNFEELKIWQEARVFAKNIFILTQKESFSKEFRFKEQIKSSSGSVMDNIAERFERKGNKEFINFLTIAKGSAGETRSQLFRAFDCGLVSNSEFDVHCSEAKQLSTSLSNFIKYLKNSEYKGNRYH